jgi:hypothetical protein
VPFVVATADGLIEVELLGVVHSATEVTLTVVKLLT